MSVLPILTWPDRQLATPCEPIARVDAAVRKLAEDMLETMYAAPGRGLAGPQVGVLRRIFVMDAGWKEGAPAPLVFVNPVVTALGKSRVRGSEGCLSIPGLMVEVERFERVRVDWTDLDGAARSREFDGFEAICVQHEADHLDGIVTLNRLDQNARAAALAAYEGYAA
ncbi:peptide deformylase [Sulfitobacter sp. D35]|uniref:peptide deformylase n=1 Tax=Sulfitobacter sp. D35 TaxID=3083252 RepID=UPI00296E43B9|nr:peptide deformylase [Sulfitobacter sp. D35]MDW4497323.1 peptide deformylase [Sulfitobacter sp. D35]